MQKDSRIRRSLSSYLRDMQDRGLSEEYIKASRRVLVKFVEHCEAQEKSAISKVSATELRGFMQKYQGMTASNQRYVYAVLRQLLKFSEHPLAFKWRWRIVGRPRQVSWLTAEQVDVVLGSKMRPREAFLVATGILAGARQIEIRRLTPKDLRSALSTGDIPFWAKNKLRYVPMHKDLIPVFETMLRVTDKADSEPILGLSSCRCARIMQGVGKQLGMELQSHKCRRTFANLTRDAGARLECVSRLLGHSSPTVTSLYLDQDSKELREAINRLHVQSSLRPAV